MTKAEKIIDVLKQVLSAKYVYLSTDNGKTILVSNGDHLVAMVGVNFQNWALVDVEGKPRMEGPELGVWGGPTLDGKWRHRLAENLKKALEREDR